MERGMARYGSRRLERPRAERAVGISISISLSWGAKYGEK